MDAIVDRNRRATFARQGAPVTAGVVFALCCLTASPSLAQTAKPLYQQDAFDQLTLTAASNNTVLQVQPLNLPNRRVPQPKPTTGRLRLRLMEDPDKEFDINWNAIEKVELFEDMILGQANRLVEAKQFDEAFHWYQFLRTTYPNTAGLQNSIQSFLFLNAGSIFKDRQLQTMAILEELYRLNSNYTHPGGRTVAQAINQVADAILSGYLADADYSSAQRMLSRLDRNYGESRLPAIKDYKAQLNRLAEEKLAEVKRLTAAEKFREAYFVSREMLGVWPQVAGGRDAAEAAARRYPIVVVGVLDRASSLDPSSIDNWPARRTGRLLHRYLMEFVGAGPEGGEYQCPWGVYERSEDLRQLIIQVDKKARRRDGSELDGYLVARRLLNLADPQHPSYQADWAELVAGVNVENVFQVRVDLRHASVLPEPVLQLPLDPDLDGRPADQQGPYDVAPAESPNETRYLRRGDYAFTGPTQPAEIVERTFTDTAFAVAALENGEIDLIDRVYPAQAARLMEDTSLVVAPYETPTLHLLIPNFERTYPASRTFRRAMLLAIDRERILRQTLLEGAELPGCRVISGPYPAGRIAEDPLAYAYDEKIEPREYFPQHASLLVSLAQLELNEVAKIKKEKPPELTALVLAHPADEQARIACQAIAAQWKRIDVPCQLKELAMGESRDPTGEWDFLYTEVLIREPIVDSPRLLSAHGVVGVENPYIGSGLRRLATASNWRDVRSRLHDLHRTTHSELAVMPLWQIVDHYAHHKGLRGLSGQRSTLYQDIERWQLEPRRIE